MGPIRATLRCFGNPFTFRGRASRSEYWWFAVATFVIVFMVGTSAMLPLVRLTVEAQAAGLDADAAMVFVGDRIGEAYSFTTLMLIGFFSVYLTLCSISAMVRRLHDLGFSGWMYWISLVPIIGALTIFVVMAWPGNRGRNAYGPPPGAAPDGADAGSEAAPGFDALGRPVGTLDPAAAVDLRAMRHARMEH